MTKLTKEIRNEIVDNATRGLFIKELEEIKKVRTDLGDRLFSKHIATPEQYELMEKLPAHFFSSDQTLSFRFNDGSVISLPLSGQKRMPAYVRLSYPNINDPEIKKEFLSIEANFQSIVKNRGELVEQIRKVVLSVNTVEKLLEVWPESRGFIPEHAFIGNTKNVPALIVANLTAAMIQAGVQFTQSENA